MAKPTLCASWGEFKTLIAAQYADNFAMDRWLFRGQASDVWRLEAGFDRIYPDLKGKVANYKELINLFSDQVKKDALIDRSILDSPSIVDNSRDIVSLAQHYGVPTRLLDWSTSPYVAAFFAYESSLKFFPGEHEFCAIWVLDRYAKDVWTDDLGVSVWEASRLANTRAHLQGGWFTELKSTDSCLEEYVASFGIDLEGDPLAKIALSLHDRTAALNDLRLMNISGQTLFPGIDGVAKDSFLKWSLQRK